MRISQCSNVSPFDRRGSGSCQVVGLLGSRGLGGQHTCQSLSCLQSFLKLLRSEISRTREMRSRMFPGALGPVDTPGGIQSEWNVPPDRLLDKFPVMLPNQPGITSSGSCVPGLAQPPPMGPSITFNAGAPLGGTTWLFVCVAPHEVTDHVSLVHLQQTAQLSRNA